MPSPRVIGIGEVLWDCAPDGKHLGGAPGNFAYHVNAQGISAVPASAVGEDDLGEELLAALRTHGIDTTFIPKLADYPTSTVDVELNEGKPTYTIHENVAWDHIPASDALLEAAKGADALCYGTLAQRDADSRETIRLALEASRPDCLRIFDVNLRQSFYNAETVDGGLRLATAFKLSDEEILKVAQMLDLPSDETAFGDALFERFGDLSLLIVTRGDSGSLLRRRDGETSPHEGVKAKVSSTVGAGDSFTAGVVVALLKGRSLAEAHDFAARLAAFVVSQPGAMPEIPGELKL